MYSLGLIGLLWLAAHFVYRVDFAPLADELAAFVAAHSTTVLMYGGFGAVALPVISLLCRALGGYAMMYLLDKCSLWLTQLLVALISFAAVVFWFETGVNLWAMFGPLGLLPFLLLVSAAASLKLFDFNYPIKETLTTSLCLAGLSWLIIWSSHFFVNG